MQARAWIGVGAAAAALQAALFVLDRARGGRLPWADETMYWRAAGRVLERGDSGLELLWPPLQTWVVAGIRALGGRGTAVTLVQIGLLALAAVALRRALTAAGAERRVADGAVALLLLYPTAGAFAHYLWPEVLHLALFCLALWLLAARREDAWACATLGSVLGLAVLAKSLLVPVLPLFVLVPALSGRRRLLRAGLVAATLAAVLAPTAWLNRQRHGSAFIGSSARFNLWVGLNDRGRPDFADDSTLEAWQEWRRSGETYAAREAATARRIRELVAERGPWRILVDQARRQYFRLFGLSSFLTEQLPGGGIHARGRGYRDPPPRLAAVVGWSHRLVYPAVALLAPWGLVCGLRRREPWAVAAAVLLAYALAIFLLLHVKSRYRIQLLPALLPAATLGGLRLLDGLRAMRGAHGTASRLDATEVAIGTAASALMALLVFGG